MRDIIVCGIIGGIGIGVGVLGTTLVDWGNSTASDCTSRFKFVNPEPDCDQLDAQAKKLDSLQQEMESAVKEEELKPGIERVAVFVRDLTSYRFAGVNDEQQFYLASLMKVPLLVAYYKFAQIEPKILTDDYTYTGEPNEYQIQDIPVNEPLTVGQTYTIEDLLNRSIRYSDNTAAQILIARLDPAILDNVMRDMGIRILKPEGEQEDIVTPRAYSNIYRLLYNSSYLNRDYSNRALELLTTTAFNEGAAAGIPKEVTVAHKFGERTMLDAKTKTPLARQLLDCGIVYAHAGTKPYSFCLMAQGKDYLSMESSFERISRIIYETMTR